MAFGPTFIQPPHRIPFKNPPSIIDDSFSDFTSGEVAAMNREFRDDLRLQEAGHND
jgi:hypothetical protein